MRRRAEVEIVVGGETREVTVEASALAVDDALVDMARRELGIAADRMDRGRVIDP